MSECWVITSHYFLNYTAVSSIYGSTTENGRVALAICLHHQYAIELDNAHIVG